MSGPPDYDLLIVGGGMAGLSLACALRDTPLRVGVVETNAYGAPAQPDFDDRTLALAECSRRIFETMGVWPAIEARGMCPIRTIHISDRGHFGIARLSAADAGVDALGYVVENRALGAALQQVSRGLANLTLHAPATLEGLRFAPDRATATIRQDGALRELRARLVVGADGTRSRVRELCDIEAHETDYGQTAVVTNVTTGVAHDNVAFERFTRTGPIAFLPMRGRCAVVWSVAPAQADRLLALPDDTFRAELQSAFGERLGAPGRIGKRQHYRLALTHVDSPVQQRLVLIGNAAHTVHPVAGQGFNLGLRDVAALAETLAPAARAGDDIGSASLLARYAKWRSRDTFATETFTNGLIRIFSSDLVPVTAARNLGLLAVDILPAARRALLQRTMGLAGRLPRLARGLAP